MKCAVVLCLVVAIQACAREEADENDRVAALKASIADFDSELAQTEAATRALSSNWDEVVAAYASVAARYRAAHSRFELARRGAAQATSAWRSATEDWQHAEASWRFYQQVVKLAVAMERARLDGHVGRRSVSCERVSTSKFRQILERQGERLDGKDIDHIVPRSLGGADHPLNYQVLGSALNRSLGATWNIEKCMMAGRDRCASAVAISARCGTYRGGF